MLTVAKFGGSSLADAERFLRVREIVRADPSRRVVVVSAAGKRHPGDHKTTDLLYLCHAYLQYHVPCWELWRRIAERYIEIRNGCGLQIPIEQELDATYASLSAETERDALASRGEYLSARLMAELLGFAFVDAADWLRFDCAGNVLREESYAALQSLADGRKIVTPGFYGRLPSGALHTFSRGGSDVTGSLAAAALHADLCENWTDVPGVLAADPRIVAQPEAVASLSYDELQALSTVGLQVLHESAVAPLRERGIPLQIRSTLRPELPGTRICCRQAADAQDSGAVGIAGRRGLTMVRIEKNGAATDSLPEAAGVLQKCGVEVFHMSQAPGQLTALVSGSGGADTLRAACEALRQTLRPDDVKVRENLSVLAVLHRGAGTVPRVIAAVEAAGVPVHYMAEAAPCLLLTVNDSQYEAALRTAYRAR